MVNAITHQQHSTTINNHQQFKLDPHRHRHHHHYIVIYSMHAFYAGRKRLNTILIYFYDLG